MSKTIPASANAWLEAIERRGDDLRIRIGLRTSLRGARAPALGLRRPNGGERVVGPIEPVKVDTGGGRITADFVAPVASILGHADRTLLVGSVLEAAVELVDDRHSWIQLPDRFDGFGTDHGDRRVSLRAASDGIMTVRDRRAARMPPPPRSVVARPRRIAIFANRITFGGGKTKALFQLAEILAEAGHRVTLVAIWASNRPPLFPLADAVGFDHIDGEHVAMPADAEAGPSVMGRLNPYASRATDDRLAAYLRASDHDLIYLPNYDSGLYRIFAENRPARTRLVIGDHDGTRGDRAEQGRLNEDFLYAIRTFDAVHTVNPLIAASLAPHTDREIFTIPNMVEADAAPARDERFFATRKLVSIGRLVPGKRMSQVVDAFARIADRFPDWTLDIYGHGPEAGMLERRIRSMGLQDRAILRGFDPRVGEAMAEGAVFVSASGAEAHPLALIEAMAAGCPVISYDRQSGARSFMRDGENGFFARDDDRGSLAARMAEVMTRIEARDPTILALIERARESVQPFSRDRVKATWLARIDALCERPPQRKKAGLLGWLLRF